MSADREIGALDARTMAVERDIKELKADVKTILAKLNEAKGFRAGMVLIIGAAGGVVVTVVQWGLDHLGARP